MLCQFLDSLNYLPINVLKLLKALDFVKLKTIFLVCSTFHLSGLYSLINIMKLLIWKKVKISIFGMQFWNFIKMMYLTLKRNCRVLNLRHGKINTIISNFSKLIIEKGKVCPFAKAVTLPFACNKIYRRDFYTYNHWFDSKEWLSLEREPINICNSVSN